MRFLINPAVNIRIGVTFDASECLLLIARESIRTLVFLVDVWGAYGSWINSNCVVRAIHGIASSAVGQSLIGLARIIMYHHRVSKSLKNTEFPTSLHQMTKWSRVDRKPKNWFSPPGASSHTLHNKIVVRVA
jgi:hypothetical protein